MASVTLKQIKKTYPNGFEALQPCSFTVEHGELLVLVGPSGCGKSTLLRMVAGLEKISGGELFIGDRMVNELDPANRDIAMVFQNYALYPHMSVTGNMGYGLRNRGVSKTDIAKKVREAAEMLDLTEYLDRKPSQLSGGQRQRVAMGRAIVRSPELFLFDEPLSNLDAKLRNQMRIEIRSLQRRLGVTSLYVTHDQVEAMTLADRIVVLNGGRVEQIGSPTEIYNEPASTFVASFMGAPPMNILNANVAEHRAMLGNDIFVPTTFSTDFATEFAAEFATEFATEFSTKGHSLDSGPVKLGVRPEDASLNTEGQLPFEVQIIEELGASRLLHGTLADQPFSISVNKDVHATTGEQRIDIADNALHWFDTTSGKRI